ncbi:MAG: PilZ domain-containing protein [Candidatus Omnitrophica bacterium]|nr:PilZ domain-containing protein [Candidatus Omnitrophota bacterium]
MLMLIQGLIIAILVLIALTLIVDEKREKTRKKHLLRLKSFWDGKNRREVIRHATSLEVDYVVKNNVVLGRSCDLSTHGIGLVLDEKLKRGTILDVNIKIDEDTHEFIRAKARVMWAKESIEDEKGTEKRLFYTGIKFIRFDSKKHEDNLFTYIGGLSGNDPSAKYVGI